MLVPTYFLQLKPIKFLNDLLHVNPLIYAKHTQTEQPNKQKIYYLQMSNTAEIKITIQMTMSQKKRKETTSRW